MTEKAAMPLCGYTWGPDGHQCGKERLHQDDAHECGVCGNQTANVLICSGCWGSGAGYDREGAEAHTCTLCKGTGVGAPITHLTPGMPHAPGGMNFRLEGFSKHGALMFSGAVRRYHTHPTIIGGQTVAEHTFRGLALMYSLWPGMTQRAMIAFLCHDGAEGEVGDVPSPAKWAYKELGKALTEAEDRALERLGLMTTLDLTEEEGRWVKICDWLEGAQFALDQLTLGNNGMAVVFDAYVDALWTRLGPLPTAVAAEIQRLQSEFNRLRR